MISTAFCIACTSAPPVAPPRPAAGPGPGPTASAPAGEVARLYNDYRHRLPCPEQAICGRGPDVPVTAVRCRPSPVPAEARCIFLPSIFGPESDRIYRCEGAFDRLTGEWWMSELVGPCRLVSERAHKRFRWTEVPDRRTIEEIESGYALREDLLAGRIAEGDAAIAGRRVKVRGIACYPWEGEAHCSYEADRCLEGETDKNGDGWCRRRARFLIGLGNNLTVSRGWTIDRAPQER